MYRLFILTLVILTLPLKIASAETKIEIYGNTGNNEVSVNSNTSSSYKSSNNTDSSTHIKINSNGEVKEYNGRDGSVHIQSSDGKTSVSVNNNAPTNSPKASSGVNAKTNIIINSNTKDSTPSSTPEATVAGVFKDSKIEVNMDSGFWDRLMQRINAIFERMF